MLDDIDTQVVDGLNSLGRDCLDPAEGEHLGILYEQKAVAVAHGQIEVVDDYRSADIFLLRNVTDNMEHLVLIVRVKAACRLVEQQILRLLHERTGEHGLLKLAAGQLVEIPRLKVPQIEHIEHLGDDALILGGDAPFDIGLAA